MRFKMNRKVLQKVIDNLNGEKPDMSYIKGLLEALIESLPEEKLVDCVSHTFVTTPMPLGKVTSTTDEATLLNNEAKIKLAKVKELTKYE